MSGQAVGVQLDLGKARAYIGEDVLVAELMAMTCAMIRREWAGLEARLDAGDLPGFKTGLHKWNGSLSLFAADPLIDASVQLEQTSREGDVERVRRDWGEMRPRLLEVLEEMGVFLAPFGGQAA